MIVQNCSARAFFERVALGQLLQGVCVSRFSVACGVSPGLTSHRSQSALAYANDEPWAKHILHTAKLPVRKDRPFFTRRLAHIGLVVSLEEL